MVSIVNPPWLFIPCFTSPLPTLLWTTHLQIEDFLARRPADASFGRQSHIEAFH